MTGTMSPVPGSLSPATLSGQARTVVVLGAVALVAVALGLPVAASMASVSALVLPLVWLCRRHLDPGSAVAPVLAAFTLFWLAMLATIELLSAFSLLGSRAAWTVSLVTLGVVLTIVADRDRAVTPTDDLLGLPPLSQALKEPWAVVVGPMALILGLLFVQSIYLNAFTGINHTDGQWFYMARSVRYLQDGNLTSYSTINDFLPHLHQTISAYLLLFTGSESSIVMLSAVFGAFACLAIFELARLGGAPGSLALLAGLSPLAVSIFSLHLGTSNFNLHTGFFLLVSIYSLLLASRTRQTRYLLLAAAGTSLALAMKLTFWFAAPGLGILWIVALVVLLRSRCPREVAQAIAVAALIVLLGGLHFLRNVWTQGFLIRPNLPEYGDSADLTARDRLDLLNFNVLATATTLVTPAIFVGDRLQPLVEDTFRRVNQRLGISLPNGKLYYYADRSWNDVFDHYRMPYLSDKAGFGAIVPLAIVPAVLVVLLDVVRRRAVFTIQGYVVLFAVLYVVSMGMVLKYAPDHVRYLIEMLLPLLILLPMVLTRLPVRVSMVYLALVAGFMLSDAYLAYRWNEQRPPDRVTTVPIREQYATFVSPERFDYVEAARVLNWKYPADEWPELFLLKTESIVPVLLEYPFLDPAARRRLTYWFGDLSQNRPAWPGLFLVLTPDTAAVLTSQFADQVTLDPLSDSVWLGVPRDRLRVMWRVDSPDEGGPSAVVLEAIVASEQYRQPEYRFVTVDSRNGRQIEVLRDYSPDARLVIPSSRLSPILEVRVDAREAGSRAVGERATVPERRMLER